MSKNESFVRMYVNVSQNEIKILSRKMFAYGGRGKTIFGRGEGTNVGYGPEYS
jgi:hypothetical protein